MRKVLILMLVALGVLVASSCKKDDENANPQIQEQAPPPPPPPAVDSTDPAITAWLVQRGELVKEFWDIYPTLPSGDDSALFAVISEKLVDALDATIAEVVLTYKEAVQVQKHYRPRIDSLVKSPTLHKDFPVYFEKYVSDFKSKNSIDRDSAELRFQFSAAKPAVADFKSDIEMVKAGLSQKKIDPNIVWDRSRER